MPSPFSSSDIAIIASLIVVISSALTLLGKLLNDSRKDLGKARAETSALVAKLMDQAIPALEHNAAATVAMVDATSKALQIVAVANARSPRGR